jgi:hypothetical protein
MGIRNLTTVDTVQSGDKVPIGSLDNGDDRKISVSVLLAFIAANLGDAVADSLVAGEYVKTTAVLVANLPAAATVGAGARSMVTDATQTLTAGIGATVAGGGANVVPVVSDGTAWKIG